MGRRLLQFLLLLILFSTLTSSASPTGFNPLIPFNFITIEPGSDSSDLLSGITAKIKDETIYLNWRYTNPKQISFFSVQRLDPSGKDYLTLKTAKKIKWDDYYEKSVDGNGLKVFKYDFEDEPDRDGVYYYRIEAFNAGGQLLFQSDEVKIGISGLKNFKLEQNYPNPFNPTTTISYEIYQDANIKVKVFDIIGREITTLVDKFQAAGSYAVEFDASKFSNLTSGIYFYKIDTDRYSEVKKMILTK